MTMEEAKRFWLIRYENAKDFSDPHWEAQERREHREYVEALRMAIEALQGDMYCPNCGVRLVPEDEYLEPKQTHGRLIDADALKENMRIAVVKHICTNTLYNTIMAVIDGSPTVQADRPHGEWIIRDESYWRKHHSGDIQVNKVVLVCSKCGHRLKKPWKIRNFCPNCGADMRKEKE